MTWKNWGDHPVVVSITVGTALVTLGYTIYGQHFKKEPSAPSSSQSSFASSPSPSAKPKKFIISWLDEKFKWNQGGNPESRYAIEASNNILTIVAGSKTDHNKLNTHLSESPRMSFPAQCDRNFEASVKVKFRSTVSAQRAIFGVGDLGRNSKYMYIYSLESSVGSVKPRVESAITSLGLNSHTNPVDYKSEFLYLKIKNISGSIDLLYSENNLDWKRSEGGVLEFPIKMYFPKNCELYFEVLSTVDEQVSGEFSNFSMKYF
jgi:hypothetical protein